MIEKRSPEENAAAALETKIRVLNALEIRWLCMPQEERSRATPGLKEFFSLDAPSHDSKNCREVRDRLSFAIEDLKRSGAAGVPVANTTAKIVGLIIKTLRLELKAMEVFPNVEARPAFFR